MNSPFKFLEAYQKDDQKRFFGRRKETAQLYNAVHYSNLTLLYGASGTGKTSLVNCGLSNKFYSTDWLPLFIRRGTNINSSFNNAIEAALKKTTKSLHPNFSKASIKDKIHILYYDYYRPIYFIFDQFEELFILGKKPEQQKFYHTILQILKATDSKAKVLLILREEWIAYMNEFEKVVPFVFENRLRVEKMKDRNLYQVILGTCKVEDIHVEEAKKTAEAIVVNLKDQQTEEVELTNLQVYLDRLYRKADTKKKDSTANIIFNPELVKQVGKMENVLSTFLDEQFQQIEIRLAQKNNQKEQVYRGLCLEVLFALVTIQGTKQALSLEEIQKEVTNKLATTKDIEFCLEAFKNIRLLRSQK